MQIKTINDTVWVKMSKEEAKDLRKRLDVVNEPIDPVIDDFVDALFDHTYTPLTEAPNVL